MSASRVPAGIPTGGQFATTTRAEAEGIRLSVVPDRPVTPLDDPNIVDCPACEGRGEIATGHRERETGAYTLIDCGFCGTTGETTRAEADEYDSEGEEHNPRLIVDPDTDPVDTRAGSWAAGLGPDPFLAGI